MHLTHARSLPLIAVVLFFANSSVAQAPADLILTNGRIYTVDATRPWVDAIAIAGDQILAAGDADEVAATAGAGTRIIDLAGAFASPGFNDAHVHMDSTGALITGVNLLDVHEPVAFAERIRGATERLPEGSWILRGSWGAYEQWGQGSSGQAGGSSLERTGPFTPDRKLIDHLTPNHPVLVSRFNGSMHLANSLALDLAGIDEHTTAGSPASCAAPRWIWCAM
jgi:predicted amidohydrolase YtcJ